MSGPLSAVARGPGVVPLALVPAIGVANIGQLNSGANYGYAEFATLPSTATITGIRIKVQGGAAGNVSVALYDANFNRLATSGAVACPNNVVATIPFTAAVTVPPGNYYLALSMDSALPYFGVSNAAGVAGVLGVRYMASAHPLPQTFVPAAGSSNNLYSLLGIISGGLVP